jgi:hypothetical protein
MNKFILSLVRDHSWKSPAILSAISFGLLILLDSFLFDLILVLIKLILIISGIMSLCYAAWLAYPLVVEKYKEESEKKS